MIAINNSQFMGLVYIPINKGRDEENRGRISYSGLFSSHKEQKYYIILRKRGGAGDHDIK